MLDDKRRADIEQECAFICEVWTRFLKNYHTALLSVGFTAEEALMLTINLQEQKLIGRSR